MVETSLPDRTLAMPPSYFYPNRMGRIVLAAMEDIIGRHGVNATLNLAGLNYLVNNYPPNDLVLGFSFEELGHLLSALEAIFGQRAGRALALRGGRETFKYALKEFMPVLGIADLAFRPLHLGLKLRIGLEVFAETFNRFTDQVVRLDEQSDRHLWIIERCPVCWGRESASPCCHLAVGLLQESLEWVSKGRRFHVTEASCIASGDETCTIHIFKKPLV
ncbi:MAG: 4-vinyl reductase [Candidatus Promineifilaceae bacterium]|nr:4-vinyl reductase [Candidatus Promineifilaceae bacterium]